MYLIWKKAKVFIKIEQRLRTKFKIHITGVPEEDKKNIWKSNKWRVS